MKLYDSEVNRSLNLMVVGPCNHGKTRVLDRILDRPDKEGPTLSKCSVVFVKPDVSSKTLV